MCRCIWFLMALILSFGCRAEPLHIVTSIKPLELLVAAVVGSDPEQQSVVTGHLVKGGRIAASLFPQALRFKKTPPGGSYRMGR